MISQLQNELHLAEEHLLKGDYGSAFYYAWGSFVRATKRNDIDTEVSAWNIASMTAKLILTDFEAVLDQRGLQPTAQNVFYLFQEHSPHIAKFMDLWRKQVIKKRLEQIVREARVNPEPIVGGYRAEYLKKEINKQIYNEIKSILLKNNYFKT